MTKAELIEALEHVSNDTEIVVQAYDSEAVSPACWWMGTWKPKGPENPPERIFILSQDDRWLPFEMDEDQPTEN